MQKWGERIYSNRKIGNKSLHHNMNNSIVRIANFLNKEFSSKYHSLPALKHP
jgi:hypothetical protein